MSTYTVQKGDTLWSISRRLGLDINQLAEENELHGRKRHALSIGQTLKLPATGRHDTEITLRILDLAFQPLNKAKLKLEYDGQTHEAVTNTEGLVPTLKINDHAKGLKVQFRHLDGSYFLIAHHETLPLGKKMLTITSRKMVVKGNYHTKEGPQHQNTKQITHQIKKQNQQAVIPPTTGNGAARTGAKGNAGSSGRAPSKPTQAASTRASSTTNVSNEPGFLDTVKRGVEQIYHWFDSSTPPQPVVKEVRTEGGIPTQVVAVVFADENLRLSPANEKYRKLIIEAAKKYGLTPHVLAALINAEAVGGDKGWQADSYNKDTGAAGLTQFLAGTWLEMCTDARSPMNQRLKKDNGYEQVNGAWDDDTYTIYGLKNKKKHSISRRDVLPWRFEPAYSIDAAALYGKRNLEQLTKKGINVGSLAPEDLAKIIYLAHHEGAGGAIAVVKGTLTKERASELLPKQIGSSAADELFERFNGNHKQAYLYWLSNYVDQHIRVDNFMVAPKGLKPKTLKEIVALLGESPSIPKPTPKENKKTSTPDGAESKTNSNQSNPTVKWHDPLLHCTLRTARLASKKGATFGMVRQGGKRAHQGIDLVAVPGTDIFSVADGKVISTRTAFKETKNYGATITISCNVDDLPEKQKTHILNKHPNLKTIYFFYAHLSRIDVNNFDFIKAGQIIGAAGDSGNAKGMNTIAKGAHLHFETHIKDGALGRGLSGRTDPLPFIENLA